MKKLDLAIVALALVVPGSVQAQGRTDYYNTESVQVDPVTVVEVGGRQYLAAVNTPDNAVELYDTIEAEPIGERFVARVRTGLEPVSLLWVPELSRLYVANALSDGVSSIVLSATGSGLRAQLDRTAWVFDEPVSLAYFPFEEDGPGGPVTRHSLVVAHRDQDAFSWIDALTLEPIGPGTRVLDATVQKGDIDQDGQDDLIAIKSPRDVAVFCDRLFLLGEKGGGTAAYDFDLYSVPTAGGTPRDLAIPNTSNFNMAFARNGDLFVVGGHALHDELRDAAVPAAPTGFVVATLTMVRGACDASPLVKQRDVNLEPSSVPVAGPFRATGSPVGAVLPTLNFGAPSAAGPGGVVVQPLMKPVPKAKAMSQLTSVAVYEPDGGPPKVYFTAFGNDWLGIAWPVWTQNPNAWTIKRLRINKVAGSSNPMAGPRGLAIKPANPDDDADPGARLYVLNRLDNAVTVVDPVTDQRLGEFPLRRDPTPLYIRRGRQFLYDARLGNGFNACASCHVDGRTDKLAWDLGDGQSPPIPPTLKDVPSIQMQFWPADKNFMITQSLQGLVSWEVDPESQDLVTNAPYHWRADREDFLAFNPAFESLLGGSQLAPDEMEAFREFVDSVHYPPNPRQPLDRTYSGVPFDGNFPTVLPTAAQAGLFVFHVLGTVGDISCAHCHALPEGSENKIPLVLQFSSPFDPGNDPQGNQPVEAAALRGLNQKVARLERDGEDVPEDLPITGLEGLIHTGFVLKDQADPNMADADWNRVASINSFIRHFFSGALGCGGNGICLGVSAVSQFLHEFDTGTAPAVGLPFTVDLTNAANTGLTQAALDLVEGQARVANAGLAVQAWLGGGERGFVYDPRSDRYVEEGGIAVLARTALLAQVTGLRDRLVFLGTPLGSERRVASPTGDPFPLPPAQPASVTLLPMSPNTAYANVPLLTFNWFDESPGPPDPAHGGFFVHSVRLLQMGVLESAPAGDDFGVAKRWEPSRRFRVAATGAGWNARLVLYVHDDAARPLVPPNTSLSPEAPGQVRTRAISLPIHPTGETDPSSGAPVYETSAEIDAREFLTLMLGGAHHPAVVAALNDAQLTLGEDPLDPTLAFDAAGRNWLFVRIVRADGVAGDGGWQQLRLE